MPPVIDIRTKKPHDDGDLTSFAYYRQHGEAKFNVQNMTLEDACYIERLVRSWKDKLIDSQIHNGITT